MTIEIFEHVAETLVDPTSELKKLADGFQFTEGPVWDYANQRLYFSDIPANTMYRYSENKGVEVYRKPSNFSNGLTIDRNGRIVACEHLTRQVTRESKDRTEVVVGHYNGKRLNSPNDVIVASDGSIIFTDPPFGLMKGLGGPAEQELPFNGVYRVAPGAKDPVLLVDDFEAPNGLALNPDESKLYIDDTVCGHIRVFDVGPDWKLSGGDVLVELKGDGMGRPDGMKIDSHGNIFCTGPGGIWICSPNATILGRIRMPEHTANLNWGDSDERSLYITASTSLYRLRCRTVGLRRY